MIKPLRPPVLDGFGRDDYAVDHEAGMVTCPNNHTRQDQREGQCQLRAPCHGYQLCSRCTTAKSGRSPHVGERDAFAGRRPRPSQD
ncbi:MAG: hypothetical protein ACRD0K_18100 [Egibacteraceae bacterium]